MQPQPPAESAAGADRKSNYWARAGAEGSDFQRGSWRDEVARPGLALTISAWKLTPPLAAPASIVRAASAAMARPFWPSLSMLWLRQSLLLARWPEDLLMSTLGLILVVILVLVLLGGIGGSGLACHSVRLCCCRALG